MPDIFVFPALDLMNVIKQALEDLTGTGRVDETSETGGGRKEEYLAFQQILSQLC